MIRGARKFAFNNVFIISIWSDLLVFVDDLCQILGMFHNSIGCVTKCGHCWHSGGKYSRQMYIDQRVKSSPERFDNILTAR